MDLIYLSGLGSIPSVHAGRNGDTTKIDGQSMANFLPQHRDELKKGLAAIAEDMAVMIGTDVSCTVSNWNLSPVAQYLTSFEPFAICCRSRYMKNSCGVGGLLIPAEGARMIAAALLMLDEEETENLAIEQMHEVMVEIWNVALGSWNGAVSPDARMSGKVAERSVEIYPPTMPFPDAAGVFFQTVKVEFEIQERKFPTAVFLPTRWVYGVNVKELNIERPFETRTVTKKRQAKSVPPVVFLDYSGVVMEQLKAAGTTHRYYRAKNLSDTALADAEEPPAVILFNAPLDFLVGMKECTFIEVHPCEETDPEPAS